jgi:hypothetical protein
LACGLALLAFWTCGGATAQPQLERAVKASFRVKFAPFVEWPQGAKATPGGAFIICLSGEDPFGILLDDVARGERISGHPVTVRRLGERGATAGCHMLFAGRSAETGYAPFADLGGRPVLTVTDSASGVPGSMIQFVMQAGRVRFRIDDGVARANGLVISSKLLGLAVRGEAQ